jgi:hypothetical protein
MGAKMEDGVLRIRFQGRADEPVKSTKSTKRGG